MKKVIKPTKTFMLLVLVVLGSYGTSFAQCYDTLGSSSNALSTSWNRSNNIVVNNDLNTVLFIHRQDISLFGGNNGVYQYDISTDNGATWQVNQGNLNPNSADDTHTGRHPQVGIYNPAGNTDPANASLVYQGTTLVNGYDWNGYVTGSLLLDGMAVSTENYNQAGVDNTLYAGGFCQSTPGTFWAIDAISNNNYSGVGFRILKGTYAAGDVTWAVNTELMPDFNLDYYGEPLTADWKMAFDPSGMIGWVALLTHLNGPTDFNYYPVFYNTTDGGATWSGPVQLDPATFSSITALEPNPAFANEIDITVDANGHPHALVMVCDPYTNKYDYTSGIPGNLFDLTFDGASWSADHVAYTTTLNTSGSSNLYSYNRPKMSRSDDGTKIVYTWVESDYSFFGNFNDLPDFSKLQPNLKAVTFDVPTGTRSCPAIYSIQCPSILNGKMILSSVSPNMLEEGDNFTVPVVVTVLNEDGDALSPVQYFYLNDLVYTAADFSTVSTPTYPAITADGDISFCEGSGDVTLTASAGSSYLWNTGETTQSIHVTDGGSYWVINPDNNSCISKDNSIYLSAVQPFFSGAYTNPVLCPSGATSLDISSFTFFGLPANTVYTWNTGDTIQILTATTPGTYIPYIDGCPALDSVVVTAPGALDNDDLCKVQPLTVGTPMALNLACATAEADEPVPPLDPTWDPQSQDGWFDDSYAGAPVANNTAWFSFIAPSSGEVVIQTDGMDTQLALYSSSDNTCTGEMTLIAANDDGGTFDPVNFITLGSVINKPYCYEPGKQYFIQVDLPLYFYGFWEGTILLTANWNIPAITANGYVLQSDAANGNQWYDQNGPIPGATSQEYTATVSGTYYTIVTVDGCSTAPSNSINVTVTSVGTLGNDLAVNVYPNPISNEVIVEIPGNTNRLSYKIVNALGQMMSTGEVTEKVVVDTRPFAPGVYYLMLTEGENMVQTKLVKR